MPTSNNEAIAFIKKLLDENERSMSWLARQLDEDRMWVSNRLRGKVSLGYEDYMRMLMTLKPSEVITK